MKMKVRNMYEYRKGITKGEQGRFDPDDNENLFKKSVLGPNDLDSFMGKISRIADKPEQVIFELIQNGHDAKAETIIIYFDEHYFLAVNSGLPFRTYIDPNNRTSGQLSHFLGMDHEMKQNEEGQIGAFGRGSKLLYKLLTPSEGDQRSTLINRILEEKASIQIFSWCKEPHLFDFLNKPADANIEVSPQLIEGDPLLIKIVNAYYPLHPGEEGYPVEDVSKFIDFANKAIQFKRNDFRFQGTAIFLELGEGKYDELIGILESDSFTKEIDVSMSILERPKRLILNGREVRQDKKYHVKNFESETGNMKVDFFHPKEVQPGDQKDRVNFLLYFPVTKEKHGLQYMLHSKQFKVDDSRETLNLSDKSTKEAIIFAGEQIKSHIEGVFKSGNQTELDLLLRTILYANPKERNEFVIQHLHENILATVKRCLPTIPSNNTLNQADEIFIKDTDIEINPGLFGDDITFRWVDERFRDDYDRIEKSLGISRQSLNEFVEEMEEKARVTWFFEMDTAVYEQAVLEITKKADGNLPFLRGSNGQLYSSWDVALDESLIPYFQKVKAITHILKRTDLILVGESLQSDEWENYVADCLSDEDLFNRIKSAVEAKAESLNRDDKWLIVDNFVKQFSNQSSGLINLKLFRSASGNVVRLWSLCKDHLALSPSGMLKLCAIRADEYSERLSPYMLDEKRVVRLLSNAWDIRILPVLSDLNYRQFLNDLERILELDVEDKLRDVSWILCSNGSYTNNENCLWTDGMSDLSDNQYEILIDLVEKHTEFLVPDKSYRHDIEGHGYFAKNEQQLSDFYSELANPESTYFNLDQLEVIYNAFGGSESSLLKEFRIRADLDGFSFALERQGTHKVYHYISTDQILIDYLEEINDSQEAEVEFELLPNLLWSIFKEDRSVLDARSDPRRIIKELLDNGLADKRMINSVIECDSTLIDRFLNEVPDIHFDSQVIRDEGKSPYKLEIKVCELFERQGKIELGKKKIFLDQKPLADYTWADTVELKNAKTDQVVTFRLTDLVSDLVGLGGDLYLLIEIIPGASNFRIFELREYDKESIFLNLQVIDSPEKIEFEVLYRIFYKNSSLDGLPSIDWHDELRTEVLQRFYDAECSQFVEVLKNEPIQADRFLYVTNPEKEAELLLEIEKPPTWLKEWLNEDRSERCGFMEKVSPAAREIRRFRQYFLNNDSIKFNRYTDLWQKYDKSFRTLEWVAINCNKGYFNLGDTRVKNLIHSAWKSIGDENVPDWMPRYILDGETIQIRFEKNSAGLCYLKDEKQLSAAKEADLLDDYFVVPTFDDTGDYQGILSKNAREISIKQRVENGLNEWQADQYERWKESNPRYEICYIKDELRASSEVLIGDRSETLPSTNQQDCIRIDEGDKIQIILHTPKGSEHLDVINSNKDKLFPGNEAKALAELLELFIPSAEKQEWLETLDDKGVRTKKEFMALLEPNRYNLGRELSESEQKTLTKLLGDVDEDMLSDILDRLKEIKDFLESEVKPDKPNSVTGLIGELLIYAWLKQKHPEAIVELKSINSLENGAIVTYSPYDIKLTLNDRTYYMDVKTTKMSVRELSESVAFFIKKNQYDWVEENSDKEYYIFRIGLADFPGLSSLTQQYHSSSVEEILASKLEEIISLVSKYLGESSNHRNIESNRIVFRITTKDDTGGSVPF